MNLLGGDPGAIGEGGAILRQCSQAVGDWTEGVSMVRSYGARGAAGARGGVEDAVARWAAVSTARTEDAARALAALGTLASSTAADLTAATSANTRVMLAGPFG